MYKKRKEKLSDTDFKKILSHCTDWLKPVVEFAYKTGQRLSEIANLQWSHVDLQNARVNIDEKMSKNGKSRIIQIDSSTFGLLEQLYEKRESNHVFSGNKNQKLSREYILRAFRRAVNRAGLKGIIFHSLRRAALINKDCSK